MTAAESDRKIDRSQLQASDALLGAEDERAPLRSAAVDSSDSRTTPSSLDAGVVIGGASGGFRSGGYQQAPGSEEEERGLAAGDQCVAISAHEGGGSSDDEEEGSMGQSSALKAAGNIFIAVVGAGVLGLPYAFAKSGLVLGVSFLTFVASLALYSMLLLAQCKRALEHEDVVSFGEVTHATLGRAGQRLVEVLLLVSQGGFCTAYLIFIKQNLASLTHVPANLCIAILLPLQIILSMLRDVHSLAPFSIVADFANCIGFAVILFDDAIVLSQRQPHVEAFQGWSVLPYLFGVAVYSFEGVGMVLPIEASMAHRPHFDLTLSATVTAITSLYVGFGVAGYLAFGDKTQDIITFNLPNNWMAAAVKLSLCIGLFFTFPPMMIPVYQIVERKLAAQHWFRSRVAAPKRWGVYRVIRMGIVTFVALVAMFVPGFGFFISLIGSLACSVLAFVIPALCHLSLFRDEMPWWQLLLDRFLIVFGVVGAVLGVSDSLRRLIEAMLS